MKKISAVALLGALVALPAFADQAGVVQSVQGSVTVTSVSGVVKAVAGTPVAANSRILVGNGAKATVILADGCVIPLKSNQFLALNPKLVCSQLVASVNQLATPYRLAQAPVGGAAAVGGGAAVGTGTAALVVGGVVAAAVVVDQANANDLSGQ